MIGSTTDRELLTEYVEQGSESAFRSLVGRHMDLVYATAWRGLNDAEAAKEITQNVFILLARKSIWLHGETLIAAWLHRATLLEVRRWWRGELRRQRRERTAVELGSLMKDEDSLLKTLKDELDEGLLTLREAERTALMLRYFEGRSYREIGALLGAREDAVRMRIGSALERLTQYFRRRGYAVPAVTTAAAVLSGVAKAAPTGMATAAANAGIAAGGTGAATGFKLALAKFTGLTKVQASLLCLVLAVAPIAWQWNVARRSGNAVTANKTELDVIRVRQSQSAAELQRLRAESARLEGDILNATISRDRYEAAEAKLEALKSRVRGLLTDAHYQWPEDLPYVRVPKSEVRSLDLLHKGGTFNMEGHLTGAAQEMLGITAEEKASTEEVLSTYWRSVLDMIENSAYQTNITTDASGRLTDTVVVPPLGEPLKALAASTADSLSNLLGSDREQILFGDWAQGGIQIFSPGNLWLIGDRPQVFTASVTPGVGTNGPSYGCGWHVDGTGVSTSDSTDFSLLPTGIFQKFFAPWLAEHGFTQTATQLPGNQ